MIFSRLSRRSWLLLALLFGIGLLNYLDRQTLSILKTTLKAELALTNIHYSWLVSAFMAPYVLFYVISGRLVDRFFGQSLLLANVFPRHSAATIAGLVGAVGASAGLLMNLVAGPLIERAGYIVVFAGLACLHPLAALMLWRARPALIPTLAPA